MKKPKKVVVYGCGWVGKYAVRELVKRGYCVTAVDIYKEPINELLDLTNDQIKFSIAPKDDQDLEAYLKENTEGLSYDLAVLAVPGKNGFQYLKALIEHTSIKKIVDVSFMPENSLQLDELARKHNKTVIVDFGVVPGLGDALIGDGYNELEITMSTTVQCGGLMVDGTYKFLFNPDNTLDLFTRDVNCKRLGEICAYPGLSRGRTVNLSEFKNELPKISDGVVAILSDGIRTSLNVFANVPDMSEETLRYKSTFNEAVVLKQWGFLDKSAKIHLDTTTTSADFSDAVIQPKLNHNNKRGWQKDKSILKNLGFFSFEPLNLSGDYTPYEITLQLLCKAWKAQKDEHDVLILRVFVNGKINGESKEIKYTMCIRHNTELNISALTWATAAPLVASAEMLLKGVCKKKGVIAPGLVGKNPKYMQFIKTDLEKQGIVYRKDALND